MGARKDHTGKRFGKLTAIEFAGCRRDAAGISKVYWRCKCDCGGEAVTHAWNLTSGDTRSCGCLTGLEHASTENMIGKKFGRLTVIAYGGRLDPQGRRKTTWLCECECGGQTKTPAHALKTGLSKSCGCLKAEMTSERFTTHGRSGTPIHNSYVAMLQRCTNRNNADYKYYGAKGITVCPRWLEGLEKFIEDMGERPEGGELERKDVTGNYEPSNCVWATRTAQVRNTNMRKDNTSGHIGVNRAVTKGCWTACIAVQGVSKRLGTFKTIEGAIAARKAGEIEYWGDPEDEHFSSTAPAHQ